MTLIEMLMSIGCGSLILAAVVTAGVAMQRSYGAIESYSNTEGDQLRVLDYLAMDCRRAIAGTVPGTSTNTPAVDTGSFVSGSWVHSSSGPSTLILSLPPYYSSVNGSATANQPSLTVGLLSYGSSSVTVSYQQSGTNFVREVIVKDSSGNLTSDITTTIAKKVSSFTVTPLDQGSTNGTVTCSIMFFPNFLRNAGTGTWWNGQTTPDAGPPDSSIGNNGDWYVVVPNDPAVDPTQVGDVYYKSGGAFSKMENVKATQLYCNVFLRNTSARQ
jgi:Tfp pilus assembly protein PilW